MYEIAPRYLSGEAAQSVSSESGTVPAGGSEFTTKRVPGSRRKDWRCWTAAPTKDPWGNTRIGVSATTKINRKDYGLTWNTALETGGILVGEEVTITLDLQFVKA